MSARERRRKRRKLAVGAGIGIGATLSTGATAQAADFTVSNLNDAGGGSLRQAVTDANNNPGADRVLFQSTLTGTLILTGGQLLVTDPVAFIGPGADQLTISEAGAQGIFYLAPTTLGGPISMSGLRFAGANASFGSVINSRDADLTLQNTVVTGNTATSDGTIYSFASSGPSRLTVDSSSVTGNNGGSFGGGILTNRSQLTVTNSTVSGNTVSSGGGGIYASGVGSTLTLDRVTMAGNNGGNFGGAISASRSQTSILRSTLSGNKAASAGAAIYASGPGGGLALDTSTLSGNGPSAFGGGISVNNLPTSITSSTIAGNSATTYAGGIYSAQTDPALSSSVIADNTAPGAPDLSDGSGHSFTAAFSLIENPATSTINSAGPNITGQDPKLGPLADNGGPTQTQALLEGSPAIDQGLASGADQRGAPRPFDFAQIALAGSNQADIGAYERVLCGGVLVNEVGTAADDIITGSAGPDGILGLGGKDTLKGLGAGDGLCGGDGKDKLKGGAGKDKLLGQNGKDKLKGGKGNDVLKGGKGKDVLIGGKGKDKLKGGPGKDKEKQ